MDPGDGAGDYTNANSFMVGDTSAVGTAVQQSMSWTNDSSTRLMQSATDALSRESTYTYDSVGNLLSVTRLASTSQPTTTTYTYDPTFNQITSITDPLGHTWSISLDNFGNPASMTDPLGNETTLTFNSEGQPLSVTDSVSDTTQFGYALGDLSAITDPLGNTQRRFTDGAGRVILSTDPQGHTIQFSYDALDHLTQTIDPLSGVTGYSYDANENFLSLTDANENTTSYTYDSRNRVITRTDPLGKTATYRYDADGNLTESTDRRGKVTVYQYDNLNRRTFRGFGYNGSGYESTISYTWDLGDRVTELADSIAGTITRSYDGLDDLLAETTPQGTLNYTYDDASRRATMEVVGQSAVDYSWDNADRLTGLTQGTSSVALSYDSASRRTSLTLPNGVVAGYTYDGDSRITGITYTLSGSGIGNLNYSYDTDGRVTGKTGSLSSIVLPSGVSGNAFNADNAMTGFNGETLSYDSNGNLTSDGTNTYTWDARNHLTAISGGSTASFVYDAYGRRAQKTVAGASTQFLYDQFNPVQELQSGSPTANLLTGLNIDEYFTRTDSNGAMDFLTDALGSTIGLTNSAGSLVTNYSYEPFGTTTASGTANANPYQFTGRANDGTGLYYYRARYYQPAYQRFVAQDPLGSGGGDANMYAFVWNNPINLLDPWGLGGIPKVVPPNIPGGPYTPDPPGSGRPPGHFFGPKQPSGPKPQCSGCHLRMRADLLGRKDIGRLSNLAKKAGSDMIRMANLDLLSKRTRIPSTPMPLPGLRPSTLTSLLDLRLSLFHRFARCYPVSVIHRPLEMKVSPKFRTLYNVRIGRSLS